jgi:hypothetical protein
MEKASSAVQPEQVILQRTSGSDSNLTQSEMVLVSMARIANGTTKRIPYEEIVLQAWKDFPTVFSLRSHPEHPDASDIHKKIYQTLKPAGLVASLGNKVFRLTDKGIDRSGALLAVQQEKGEGCPNRPARLSRSEHAFFAHAAQSQTYSIWKQGEARRLIDHDARLFYQSSTGTSFDDRRQKAEFAAETFEKAQMLGLEHSASLSKLSEFLVERFKSLFEGVRP